MQMHLREVNGKKPPTPESSPRDLLPNLPPPKQIPPKLAALMAQFAVSSDKSVSSPFVKELSVLVNLFEPHFREAPFMFVEEWVERKADFLNLKAAISTAKETNNDFPLFIRCLNLQKQSGNFWARWKDWNYLSALKELVLKHLANDLKGLRLQPPVDMDQLDQGQKYLELVIHYYLAAQKVYEMEAELRDSKDYVSFQGRITQLTKELATSQGARKQVMSQLAELERRHAQLQQSNEGLQKTNQDNLKKMEELEAKVAELRTTVQLVREQNKTLADKNAALELKAVRSPEKIRREAAPNTASQEQVSKLATMELELQQKDREIAILRQKLSNAGYKESDFAKFHKDARAIRRLVKEGHKISDKLENMQAMLVSDETQPRETPNSRA